jgi:caffeoyl-CoA O-methyltransferase
MCILFLKALNLTPKYLILKMNQKDIDQYIENHSSPESTILNKIYRDSNLQMINPRMVSGHIQGLFLKMISLMIKPKNILEIGTYTGYSAICLAQGLAQDGNLHTIEINDELISMAHDYFESEGLSQTIIQHVGNALEIIPELNHSFDLIFIDGEKREYPQYYNICVDKLNSGGYLIADNVLWNGKVVDQATHNESATKAILEFNKMVQEDVRTENVLLPIRDGLMMVRKL